MRALRNCRGIAIVYVTLFLLVLGLVFLALGIDVGWLSYVRSQGQAAVDSAALSAAAALPNYNNGDGSKVSVLVSAYSNPADASILNDVMTESSNISISDLSYCTGNPNGIEASTCAFNSDKKWTVGGAVGGEPCFKCGATITPAGGVKVTKPYTPRTFFARLFNGGNNATVNVSAIAWMGGASTVDCTDPNVVCANIAIRECQIPRNPPETGPLDCGAVPLAVMSPDSGTDNSAFTTFFETGGNECKDLASGTTAPPPNLAVTDPPTTIQLVGSGVVTSCLRDLRDRFLDERNSDYADPSCPPGSPDGLCWRVVVPIIECDGDMATGDIVGFATFDITDIIIEGNTKIIMGSLACPAFPSGGLGLGPDFGTLGKRPVLIK